MKVLFIGGTGVISSACAARAVEAGIELTLLNRGRTTRPVPEGVRLLHGDRADLAGALGNERFDTVVDWIVFTPDQVQAGIDFFRGRTGQYVFISSASAYQKPVGHLPLTESTPLYNPYWAYSRNKIACEDRLVAAYRASGFPMTIVRPSHTYDRTKIPLRGGYTTLDRMRRGERVIVHGDGTSLWVLTHHTDFAKGFVGLLGQPRAIGDAFHITGDEVLTWDQIYRTMATALGVEARLVHVASETLAAYDPEEGAGLLGDKAHSVIFDNTKIKRLVPGYQATVTFAQGAREIVAWYAADPARQVVDPAVEAMTERLLAAWDAARPG